MQIINKKSIVLGTVGEGGALGKYTGKINIPKSKFDKVFDIRKEYCLCIQSLRKIHLLGYSIQRLWGKCLEISRNFSMGPLFSKYDWMGADKSGL